MEPVAAYRIMRVATAAGAEALPNPQEYSWPLSHRYPWKRERLQHHGYFLSVRENARMVE